MPSRPRIIGVVTDGNRRDAKAWEALAACDMAEFRADTMVEPGSSAAEKVAVLLRDFREEGSRRLGRIPETLLTIRLRRDGGQWPDAKASEREAVWRAAASGGRACEWLDIETEEVDSVTADLASLLKVARIKVLISHHDFQSTPGPEGFRRKLAAMEASGPAAVKFAVTCRTRAEVVDLLAFAKEAAAGKSAAAVFSMGGPGRSTRVLAPLLGCPFTYGYLTGGAVAPGQLSASELRAFFDGAPFPPSDDPATLLNWAEGRLQEAGHAQ